MPFPMLLLLDIRRARVAWVAALFMLVAAGCKTPAPSFPPTAMTTPAGNTEFVTVGTPQGLRPEWLQPPTEPFRLGPGDRVEIELLGVADRRSATFVCPDGKVYYDLLPGMDVWGMTLAEAKAAFERELAAYYKRPQVVVNLRGVESKRVWVLGRLNKCGVFPLTGPMTVIDAISQAGGLFTSRFGGTTEELADLNHSFLIRKGEFLPVNFQKLLREGDTAQNIYLEADDFLYLPSSLSQEVYVLGAVNRPSPLGYSDNMGLVAAISKGLGTQPDAHLAQVAIIRGSLADPKIAVVDFKAILMGRAPDVRLEPRDIVFVPSTPYRTLERYARMVTDTFVKTVAANEGGRAAASRFQGLGVSSPIQ